MRRRAYVCLHIPTGQTFNRETENEVTPLQFYDLLDSWNRIGGSVWKYWS